MLKRRPASRLAVSPIASLAIGLALAAALAACGSSKPDGDDDITGVELSLRDRSGAEVEAEYSFDEAARSVAYLVTEAVDLSGLSIRAETAGGVQASVEKSAEEFCAWDLRVASARGEPTSYRVRVSLADALASIDWSLPLASNRLEHNELDAVVADSMAWYARTVDPEVDFAFANAGSIRRDLGPGAVTQEALGGILPYDDELCIVDLDGAMVQSMLDHAADSGGSGGFGILSSELSYAATADAGGTVTAADVLIGGDPIDAGATYRVALTSFLVEPDTSVWNDGYAMLREVTVSARVPATQSEILYAYLVAGGAAPAKPDTGDARVSFDFSALEALDSLYVSDLWQLAPQANRARYLLAHGPEAYTLELRLAGIDFDLGSAGASYHLALVPGESLSGSWTDADTQEESAVTTRILVGAGAGDWRRISLSGDWDYAISRLEIDARGRTAADAVLVGAEATASYSPDPAIVNAAAE